MYEKKEREKQMCSFDDIVLIREPYLESSHVEAKEWIETV